MTDLKELINDICFAEYEYIGCDKEKRKRRVGEGAYFSDEEAVKSAISGAVYSWASKQLSDVDMTKRIGELEAKVYTYEKIIANSNFAPMIQPTIVEAVTEFPAGEKGAE